MRLPLPLVLPQPLAPQQHPRRLRRKRHDRRPKGSLHHLRLQRVIWHSLSGLTLSPHFCLRRHLRCLSPRAQKNSCRRRLRRLRCRTMDPDPEMADSADVERALAEMRFCEAVLAKSGLNVLTETLRDADSVAMWEHYPPGDVFDPASGAQWYYHSHAIGGDGPGSRAGAAPDEEHGHYHCFIRPQGAEGPNHHLIAVGVDAFGRLTRLFTVNQWVVGDDWLDGAEAAALVEHFDVQMARPSYLVNRWLTAVVAAYEAEIRDLILKRGVALSAVAADFQSALQDRNLEVLGEYRLRP